jgi:ABC-2 type transport system ATP-binding protein
VDFRLLGAVEGWAEKEQLDLGPRKQRFVFAILALNVNQLVSVDRLVDLTWPTRPPKTAHHAIHVRVSQLRSELAKVRTDRAEADIVTHGSAYVLKVSPLSVDVHRFRALLTGARTEQDDTVKVTMLRRALDLWHGPPLADVATPEMASRLCHSLTEGRLVAIEECIDAELRLGRHNEVIDELTALTTDHPYRQRLYGQLMVALYRAGRAADALEVYRVARSRLADEHALDPEARLRALQTAILRADPALDLPRPKTNGTVVRTRRTRPLVGTAQAVDVRGLAKRLGARSVLEDVTFSARQGEVVGLAGDAGAGKTTLVRLLSTTLTPTGGDFSIADLPSSRPAEIRRRIGVLPQCDGFRAHQTAAEHLRYHARLFGIPRTQSVLITARLLARVRLTEHASSRLATCSATERRLLGIARALVNDPAVVLLDEPTAELDPTGQRAVLDVLSDVVSDSGKTFVLFTRWPQDIEPMCDRVVVLEEGRIVDAHGTRQTPSGLAAP